MDVKEAMERFPEYTGVLSILPDDAYIDLRWEIYAVEFGLCLRVSQVLSGEVAREFKDSWLVRDWYRKMHDQLIQSEISWEKKMAGLK